MKAEEVARRMCWICSATVRADVTKALLKVYPHLLMAVLEDVTDHLDFYLLKEMGLHHLIDNPYPFDHLKALIPLELITFSLKCYRILEALNPVYYLEGGSKRRRPVLRRRSGGGH